MDERAAVDTAVTVKRAKKIIFRLAYILMWLKSSRKCGNLNIFLGQTFFYNLS